MSIIKFTRRAYREPIITPEQLEKLEDWFHRPFTPRTECLTVAVAGIVMFLLFVAAAAIGG